MYRLNNEKGPAEYCACSISACHDYAKRIQNIIEKLKAQSTIINPAMT
jgi:hypothetical protein